MSSPSRWVSASRSPSAARNGLTRKRTQITKRVINGVYNGVTTVELDNLAAETAAYMTTRHPVCLRVRLTKPLRISWLTSTNARAQDYAILAARIAISNLHKETKKTFSHVITDLYNYSA
jgi:hypothetical protein